ncbi:MAG: hypothetical protein AB7E13_06190 [Arcobacteraceae bacterium]
MLFGIRRKILILGLATVIVTIFMISSLFIFNLVTFHKHNSTNEIDLIHTSISSGFNTYTTDINKSLDVMIGDDKLQANLSIMKNYMSFADDNFEDLRRSMAVDLIMVSQVINSDFLVIFDSINKPVAFSSSRKMSMGKDSFIGYLTYGDKNRVIYTKPMEYGSDFSRQFTQADKLDFFSEYLFANTNQNSYSIVDYKHSLFLSINKEIYDKDNQKIGTIAVFKLIDSELLSKVQSVKDVHVLAKYRNILYGVPEELARFESKIQEAMLNGTNLINIEDIELNIHEKSLQDGLSMIYLTNFYELQEEIDSLKKSVIWSTALVILLLLPFGYWFVKNYINFPIEKLLEDIKNFRLSNKIVHKDIKLNDEFGVFQKAFYDMRLN